MGCTVQTSVGMPSGCQTINHSQALEHDVKSPQFDRQKLLPQICQTGCLAGCNYSVRKTFPADLITGVFLALVLNLFAH